MARRGDELREHIRWTAKDVFLELGFERTSMDVVAARAETSKRSLYAYFESKEKLFLAVIELVRGLFLSRLGTPSDYRGSPHEALVIFCGRYLETLIHEGSIQMFRLSAAETSRFPAGAARYFDVVFAEVQTRLSGYLVRTFATSQSQSDQLSARLLGQILYPGLPRALFGVDPLTKRLGDALSPKFELDQIRSAVMDVLRGLHQPSSACEEVQKSHAPPLKKRRSRPT